MNTNNTLASITENSSPNRAIQISVVVWAVALLIAFFAYRGADVGQLPSMLRYSGGAGFGFEGFRESFLGALIGLLIVVSWFGVGSFAVSHIKTPKGENHSHILELAVKTALGAAIWSLFWFFLGLANAYIGATAIAALAIGLGAALAFVIVGKKQIREESRVPEKPSGFDWALLALIAVPVILAFIAALAPPTAKDTLLYHFSVPKAFIAQGNSAFIEGNIASYLALGTEMHAVWAMLLGNLVSPRVAEAAAGATTWAFFPILLLAIFGWARELNASRRWSLIAVLMVAAVPTAYHVAASAYIDLALALYVTLAIYSLGRWWKSQETGWLVYIAIFLGAALSIKLTALFVIAAFALAVLLRARQAKDGSGNLGRILGGGFAALILAGVIASPWYLRTWSETGSPVFPFYMSIWEGSAVGWDVERSNLFQAMNSHYGGADKSVSDYLAAPWNLSVAAQPEQAEFFDGVLGVAFLFGLPLLIWTLWKFDVRSEIKIGVGVVAMVFMFWLFSSQQLRYLLPILPVLAIGIVMSAETISKQIGQRGALEILLAASSVAGILVSAAWFLQKAPLRVVLGNESKDAYLSRNLDYYPYYQILRSETNEGEGVWLINMRRDTYNLTTPYFSDYLFEDWTLRQMLWDAENLQELRTRAREKGSYVLTRHDFLFDYDKSPLVDDRKSRAENEAKLKIARELILDPSNTIRADKKFSLVKVF